MTNITTLQASELARAFHDAMTMVSTYSAFQIPPTQTPQSTLDRYLRIAKQTGVSLHNEHWEKHAQKVVNQINQKRAETAKALFG